MVAFDCNSSIQKAEAGVSEVQDQLRLWCWVWDQLGLCGKTLNLKKEKKLFSIDYDGSNALTGKKKSRRLNKSHQHQHYKCHCLLHPCQSRHHCCQCYPWLSTYYEAGTNPVSNFKMNWCYYCLHFADVKTETQGHQVIYQRPIVKSLTAILPCLYD